MTVVNAAAEPPPDTKLQTEGLGVVKESLTSSGLRAATLPE